MKQVVDGGTSSNNTRCLHSLQDMYMLIDQGCGLNSMGLQSHGFLFWVSVMLIKIAFFYFIFFYIKSMGTKIAKLMRYAPSSL